MAGQGVIELTGTLNVSSNKKNNQTALSQSIGTLETKESEQTIQPGTTRGLSLGLSAGVDEALFVKLYSPRKVLVELVSSDVEDSGPFKIGLKGEMLLTLTPGAGIVAISVTNPDPTVPVIVSLVVGAKAQATDDDPSFYTDS